MKLYHYVNKKSSKPNCEKVKIWLKGNENILWIVTLTLISFWTRFRLIDKSNIVVWDEAHFGKFGAHYIEHEYYVDVHPPLAKLLVALSQWITGFDGKFKFESGAAYPSNVDYRSMRLFQAFWGSLVVPLAYITTQQFNLSRSSCILSALMVLCDTAYLCINRFILLDSVLLFFTALSLYSLFGFHNVQNKSFTFLWWKKLSLLGISLGCVLSVKWVGLFTVALVGIYTIEDLWEKLADSNISNMEYIYHWVARILNLIILPAMVYLLCFKIHFNILYKSGPGDQSMSSLFQATLKGNEYENTPLELAIGSNITLRNFKGEKPFLHSHSNYYPYGSQLQQITGYDYNDTNNEWTILSTDEDNIEKNIRYVHHGDTIRLNHIATNINLLATSYPSPLSFYTDELLFEVSGGNKSILPGDIIDHWKITAVKDINNYKGNKIHSFTTLFQLRHVVMDCLLVSTNNILPKWGYKQLEIACIRDGNENDPSTFWSIDMHKNIHLPTPIKGTYKSTFLRNFLELNQLMWNINNGLVSDPDKEDILSSTPSQWPLMTTGVRMIGWDDNILKFYLLGNPIVWWASFASVIIFSISATIYSIRAHRNIINKSQDIKKWKIKVYIGKYLFIGWILHYIPFFIMGRVMYLHHYFQALYFSILLVSYLFDHFTMNFSKIGRLTIYAIFMMFIILNFIYFSPFAYGMHGAINKYEGRRWLKSWNLTKIY